MISVIISTHKREPSIISRAIESVLHQTYRNIEIIVVDDSPPDYYLRADVAATIHKYTIMTHDIHIRYYAHEKNRGACAARNTGIKYAEGDYIACLDDDDEWLPTKLEKQLQEIESSGAALVYCGCICRNDITGKETVRKTEYCRGSVFYKLLFQNFIDSTSIPLINKECLKSVGGFDEMMQSAQDYDLWIRIASQYTIDFIEEPLVIYHEHAGEQITSNPQKKINGLERLNKKYESYLNEDKRLWHRRNISITPYYAMAGNRGKAFHIWLKCVLKCPGKAFINLKYLRLLLFAKKKVSHG